MSNIGIIAEYNPFHSGHAYHIREVRRQYGADSSIVCVMSGNWVQRGDAAIADKWVRASLALQGGADLILELPTVWATASAEAFARGSVSILDATGLLDVLSFGSEIGSISPLLQAAQCFETAPYRVALRHALDRGLSFAAARQEAANACMGADAACLKTPNNNLAVEYIRALRAQNSSIIPSTVLRCGTAHDSIDSHPSFASASLIRSRILAGTWDSLTPYLSEEAVSLLSEVGPSSLSFCTRAVLARLRTMSPDELAQLPDSGEGLSDRLWRSAQGGCSLEELYGMSKTRRYAHARIRRLVLWAFLGLEAKDRPETPPYLRILGMNPRGQALLKQMKHTARLPILTKPAHAKRLDTTGQRLFQLEARCTSLFDLCRSAFGKTPARNEYSSPVLFSSIT